MNSPSDQKISWPHFFGLVGGAVGIAFAPIFAVLGARIGNLGLIEVAFWRLFFGTLAIGLVFFFSDRTGDKSGETRWGAWMWFPGLIFAGDFAAWHWSFEHTSVANSTLLANVAIVFITIFSWLVWKEKISRAFLVGALVAAGGVVLLVASSAVRETPPVDGDPVFGDFLALVTACFYGTYLLLIKYFRRWHSAPRLLFWASAVAAALMLPVALIHQGPIFPDTLAGWWPLVALGVISHAGGQGLIAYGLKGVPASLGAMTLLVQPVCTAGLGVWILGQDLIPMQVLGGGVVLLGLALAIRSKV
ncbi:MAG: EamA family transporter [Verrucomicrobiota bacterium]